MLPCFTDIQDYMNELTSKVNDSDERMVSVQNDLIQSMQKVEKLQDALLIEKDSRSSH